jgi:hypothetical protein
MYAFMKSQGAWLEPWRDDVRVGAVRRDGQLLLTLAADQPWKGRLHFDHARHKAHLNMPLNYPRLNEFPEWFTVDPDRLYRVRLNEDETVRLGGELIRGIDLELSRKGEVVIQVSTWRNPPYGSPTHGPAAYLQPDSRYFPATVKISRR